MAVCTISDYREAFHVDVIQALVARHSQIPFEIAVEFVERGGAWYPVIVIPPGVTTPAAVKLPVNDSSGRPILKVGEVPFRTLYSNNVVSSANARPQDWDDIVTICLDNREADIGRFIRRHLGGVALADILKSISAAPTEERSQVFADQCWERFKAWASARGREPRGTFEVACVVDPELPKRAPTKELLHRILVSNPQIRAWPIWLDTRSFVNQDARYKVVEGGYEAALEEETFWDHLEFFRIESGGRFYACRRLTDDANAKARGVQAGMTLEPMMVIVDVLEAMIVAGAFARALDAPIDRTELRFTFRWRGLAQRYLASWISGLPPLRAARAHDDEVMTHIALPLDVPSSALAPYALTATEDLV